MDVLSNHITLDSWVSQPGMILPPRGRLAMSEKCWVVTTGEGRGAGGAALGISVGKARAAAPHPSVRWTALHDESLHDQNVDSAEAEKPWSR